MLGNMPINNFVVCTYDGFEWLGVAASFSWPVNNNVCWVTNQNVLAIVEAPALTTVTGRQYCLNPDDIAKINEKIIYNSH